MKYLPTALTFLAFITIGCDTNTTESNNEGEITEHSTVNVKTPATEYFSFANNTGSADATSTHDIVFYALNISPAPGAPEISFPYFKARVGLNIAPLKNSILEDVTDVPPTADFVENYSTEGDDWFHMVNQTTVVPDENVYVVNTTDGKLPAFEIINYYDDQGESGVFTINWKYLSE